MKSTITFILSILLYTGCSGSPEEGTSVNETEAEIPEHIRDMENLTVFEPEVEPPMEIDLVREVSFGEIYPDRGPPTTGQKVAVDTTGRVFISDGRQNMIQVFNPDGTYLTSIGRSGEGPGEFSGAPSIDISENELLTDSPYQQRIQFFSLETLELSHIINMNPSNWDDVDEIRGFSGIPKYLNEDGNTLLAGFPLIPEEGEENYTGYYILDMDGMMISDMVIRTKEAGSFDFNISNPNFGSSSSNLPPPPGSRRFLFNRKPILSVSENGFLYLAWSENLLIKVYDSEGNYLRAFYHLVSNRILNPDDIDLQSFPDRYQRAVRNGDLPENWPALDSMMIDDEDRLWISTIVDSNDVYEWWVLQDTGKLIAKFTWPRDQPIEVVKNGSAYTRETDEMGVETIVRYRIEMGEVD